MGRSREGDTFTTTQHLTLAVSGSLLRRNKLRCTIWDPENAPQKVGCTVVGDPENATKMFEMYLGPRTRDENG